MPFSKSDTIQTTAICSLKVNREDIVAAAYHKIDVLGAKNNYTFTKYDGNNLLISRSTLDSLSYPSKTHIINKEDNNFLSYIYGFDDYLIMGHYETKRPFRQMNSLIAKLFYIKKVNVEEAIHNGTPVYILSISTRNRKNFMEDAVMHHYIRKSDFLPIAYSFSGHFENIEEYEYYEIEYLNINSNIPLEHFTVHEEDQQLILKDLYKDFTERLNQ